MILRPANVGVHWQAPTVIILSYSASLAFAIGHHVFYTTLDQMSVDDNLFGQQTNIAIGTAFAFLFRACLVLATCTSYWQVFWATALRNTLTISNMDALAGVLSSLLDFISTTTFFRNPGLAALALLAWVVPFASLLPPATLSVLSAATTNNTYSHVPVPHFANITMADYNYRSFAGDKFSGIEGGLKSTNVDMYLNPTFQLSRLATTTAYRGTVPDHRTPHANSTYEIEFSAPAVQCQPASRAIIQGFNKAAGCNFTQIANWPTKIMNPCEQNNAFMSWVPNDSALVPFGNGSLRGGFLPLDEESGLSSNEAYSKTYLGHFEHGPATLFVATRSQNRSWTREWDVMNCSLFNASYSVRQSSDSNSRSQPYLSKVRILDSVPFTWQTSTYDLDTPRPALYSTIFSYLALMECLNRLLVGSIVGTEPFTGLPYWTERDLRYQNPSMKATSLAFSAELVPLLASVKQNNTGSNFVPDGSQWTNVNEVEGIPDDDSGWMFLPRDAVESPSFNQPLGAGIEQLFQNFTLALFSEPRFLRDSDGLVNVTVSYTRNIYSYSSRNLLISYGVALGLTLLASLAGCIAIFCNRASYTNRFSTIMRSTAGFEDLVHLQDRTGADPLPKYLAKSRIDLGRREGASEGVRVSPEAMGERSAMMNQGRGRPKAPEVVSQRSVSPIT